MQFQVGRLTIIVALVFATDPCFAVTLRMPPSLRRAADVVARDCPECLAHGFMTCGTADVAYGKRFARTALQGRPQRGYLMSFVMSGDELRQLARRTPYDPLLETLRTRFSRARIVILEAPGARVLPPPQSLEVNFPRALHSCVHDSTKPWGCCIAANCRDECCEKALGSATISLAWNDAKSRESITLTFHHAVGFSQLRRTTARGELVYFCLVDQPARITD